MAYDNGMYLRAISLLKQLPYHNNPRLLTNLGSAENEIGNYTGALSFYRQALQLDRHHIRALLGIGTTLVLLDGDNHISVTYFIDALAQPVSATGNDSVGKLERALALPI